MEKYRRFYGLFILLASVILVSFIAYSVISPKIKSLNTLTSNIEKKDKTLRSKQKELTIVKDKIKKIQDSISTSQKKIYSPVESDLGKDSLFFNLYSDVIEMVHANSVKIKSIKYSYNPAKDTFVEFGKDVYFVCDIDMELVSNYVNLGKLVQDVYQYPYYIKINELNIKPYSKDKKILLSTLSLRLYAHTMPLDKD